MKPACVNHPAKTAVVRGMCQACYVKERRNAARPEGAYAHRRTPTGATVATLLQHWNQELTEKLYAKVDAQGSADECHIWIGPKTRGGYGMITLGGHNVLAHRMTYALATGETHHEVVMHACDNPSCVNPKHLRGGTHQENVDDMLTKGRGPEGSKLGAHLRKRDTHPRARPVRTPRGDFPSATLAAEAMGLNVRLVARRCQTEVSGWRYRD